MSNTIHTTRGNQPEFEDLSDAFTSIKLDCIDRPQLSLSASGYHSTDVDLPLHMYDLLHDLLNNHKVVEYYEELRNKGK